jgi:hypothetical protein
LRSKLKLSLVPKLNIVNSIWKGLWAKTVDALRMP